MRKEMRKARQKPLSRWKALKNTTKIVRLYDAIEIKKKNKKRENQRVKHLDASAKSSPQGGHVYLLKIKVRTANTNIQA